MNKRMGWERLLPSTRSSIVVYKYFYLEVLSGLSFFSSTFSYAIDTAAVRVVSY